MKDRVLKPYQLVLVKEAAYSFYGETISHPMPEGSIMVRDVPNDPSTMRVRALPLDPAPKGLKWVQYAEVSGSFSFPIDMLRYDVACPVNFSLVEDHLGRVTVVKKDPNDPKLIIARIVSTKGQSWTYGRWSSFLWDVKPLRTVKYVAGQ